MNAYNRVNKLQKPFTSERKPYHGSSHLLRWSEGVKNRLSQRSDQMEGKVAAYQAGMEQSELLGAVQNVIHRLHADHARVVLIRYFVLIRSKAATGPDVLLAQPRQRLLKHGVSLQRRCGVTILEATIVDRDNFIGRLDHARVNRSLDGFLPAQSDW